MADHPRLLETRGRKGGSKPGHAVTRIGDPVVGQRDCKLRIACGGCERLTSSLNSNRCYRHPKLCVRVFAFDGFGPQSRSVCRLDVSVVFDNSFESTDRNDVWNASVTVMPLGPGHARSSDTPIGYDAETREQQVFDLVDRTHARKHGRKPKPLLVLRSEGSTQEPTG